MTHSELCERAAKWLRNSVGCRIVLREVVSYTGDIPDAIGWKQSTGWSTLVECKVSRSDFHRDKDKYRNRYPENSLGARRYYMTPPGLLRREEAPEGWGLLEAHARSVVVVVKAPSVALSAIGFRAEIMHLARGIRMINGEDTLPTKRSEALAWSGGPRLTRASRLARCVKAIDRIEDKSRWRVHAAGYADHPLYGDYPRLFRRRLLRNHLRERLEKAMYDELVMKDRPEVEEQIDLEKPAG